MIVRFARPTTFTSLRKFNISLLFLYPSPLPHPTLMHKSISTRFIHKCLLLLLELVRSLDKIHFITASLLLSFFGLVCFVICTQIEILVGEGRLQRPKRCNLNRTSEKKSNPRRADKGSKQRVHTMVPYICHYRPRQRSNEKCPVNGSEATPRKIRKLIFKIVDNVVVSLLYLL